MGLDIYCTALLVLMPCVALVAGRSLVLRPFRSPLVEKPLDQDKETEARTFRRVFLQVYLLVMGSEWLQGPYMYSLLRDEKRIPEGTVAILYTTVYVAAAASAPFTGFLADRFGRRSACLSFCAIHSLATLSVLSDSVAVLVFGRVLGGIGITLLWTAFESWMVTEYKSRELDRSSIPLSAMFAIMTTANCITAILAGVLAHCVVLALGSKTDLFMVGLVLDALAAVLLLWTWDENYGVGTSSQLVECQSDHSNDDRPWRQKMTDSFRDGRIWALSFISCGFEGTIFLLMFFWPGALREAHGDQQQGSDGNDDDKNVLPYGVIFANFMATMVLGALLFNVVMGKVSSGAGGPGDRSLPTDLLALALLVAGAAFLAAAMVKLELYLFCAFLVVQACNGIYVPSMAYQRGRIVGDSGRASVYGFMNIPLFIFVIAALLTRNGEGGEHRHIVFILCAVFQLATAATAVLCLRSCIGNPSFSVLPVGDVDDTSGRSDL